MHPQPLSHQALDPVPDDRVPYFPGDRQAEPAGKLRIRAPARNPEDVAPMELLTARLHREVIDSLTQAHLLRDPERPSADARRTAARCSTSHVTSWRPSPRCASGPWPAGGGAPHVHLGSSCVRGSRACASGSCCAADMYASRLISQAGSGAGSILNPPREVKVDGSDDSPRTSPRTRRALAGSSRTSGVHLRAFWACKPKSPSDTNPELFRLWTPRRPTRASARGPVDNLWIGHPFVCES